MQKLSFDLCENYLFKNDENTQPSSDNSKSLARAKRILKRIIAEDLTERQKQICILYYYYELDMPSIADQLGINKSTVSRTLARALKNINDRMKYYKLR